MNYYGDRDPNKEYPTLVENNPDAFKVYQYNDKIRCGSSVIGEVDTRYDCYISSNINDDFSADFVKRYGMNEFNSFGVNEKTKNIAENPIMSFVSKRIGSMNDEKTTNLSPLLDKYCSIFMKIDIEGAEWEWLSAINEIQLANVAQIVIEFHCITNTSWHWSSINHFVPYTEKLTVLEKMASTHYLIHAHGNNADRTAYNGIPNVIEMTYINKRYFSEIPSENTTPFPIDGLDFPKEKKSSDIDLNFYPFVNTIQENPFLVNIKDKVSYTYDDYISVQRQLNDKNIDDIIAKLYKPQNNFYGIRQFKQRIGRGISQNIIDLKNKSPPSNILFCIGHGGNKKDCIVCCTPFNNQNDESRLLASQQIRKSLEEVGYNGHFYLFNGGFPNPTGTEMKYAGVPYCFKPFVMLEAANQGFERVIWIDAGCYTINNPQPLFDLLGKQDTIIKRIKSNNNYNAMSFQNTIRLLNQMTGENLHNAAYIETIVFGLNLKSDSVKSFIADYYNMVKVGWPFFSIFPEEIVFSAMFNQPKYKHLLYDHPNQEKLQIHEKDLDEESAKKYGYFFHHKNYSKFKNTRYISFQDNGGRFGNQLFCYVACKLFTIIHGYTYVLRDHISKDNFITVTENNIAEYLNPARDISNQDILLSGFFQNSELYIPYRKELTDLIFRKDNEDYWEYENKQVYIKDYLIRSKHSVDLSPNDVVLSLRLDDFIQYPCKTSDILPPQYYIDILNNIDMSNRRLYIVCDKIALFWEFKYITFFEKWNPILIQNSLIHDIALMRDSHIYIHSNSSLSWIISFLSTKKQRYIPYTPKTHMNRRQSLKKIEDEDVFRYVTPLDHDEVHNLDVNDTKILPLSFCIPDECIVNCIPKKRILLAPLIPGDMSTYIYGKHMENEYHDMYRQSRFAITKMKGGWDCLRHYEILMNGCIPLFENLNACPEKTMTTYPKHLNDEAYQLYNNWKEDDQECLEKYDILCNQFLDHTRQFCTTSYTASYFLENIKNGDKIRNILLITGHHGVNYNRETLWIGLKRYIKSVGGVAVEYEKMPFLYDDFDLFTKNKYCGDSSFTFPKRLPKDADFDMPETEILEKIENRFWDLIIYGKVGPDEFCHFPYFDRVKANYNKNKIAFIYGGDEIFDLTKTDPNSYHINMFNRAIYYKPYSDYLNKYKVFGTSFVRELNM